MVVSRPLCVLKRGRLAVASRVWRNARRTLFVFSTRSRIEGVCSFDAVTEARPGCSACSKGARSGVVGSRLGQGWVLDPIRSGIPGVQHRGNEPRRPELADRTDREAARDGKQQPIKRRPT
jgi:hypothetical protein